MMLKNIKIITIISAIAVGLIASDHIDSPLVTGATSDIADFYAFQGENTNNIVFVATMDGLLSPTESETVNFDQNVLVEFKIDTDADNVEDLVIQAIRRGDDMHFFGPVAPKTTTLENTILTDASIVETVKITPYGEDYITRIAPNGIKYFAGVTDDPFYFDIAQYKEVITGNASGFKNPGHDTWNGLNVLSIAIEVPKVMLGDSPSVNTWVTASRKQ